MKAIALIIVHGGVAYPYAPDHVDVRVIDRDDVHAGGDIDPLPAGIGFEALVEEAGLTGEVPFKKGGGAS